MTERRETRPGRGRLGDGPLRHRRDSPRCRLRRARGRHRRDGLRLAAQSDVVLLDIRLPDVDGFEVCRRLKANPATASIPILHLSGIHRDVEDRVRGLETGADAYLSRPVEAAELVATLRALLRLSRTQVRLEESEARRRTAEALADVSRALARLRNPAEVAQCVTDSVRSLLDAPTATLYRLGETGRGRCPAVSGAAAPAVSRGRDPGARNRRVGAAVRERRAILTPNVPADPRVSAGLVVPLVLKDDVIGVLLVGDREGRVFTGDEMRLTEAFADQAALALENAELYAQAERRRREAEVLAELAQTINASPDLATILKRVAERARELCDADLARVALQEPGSEAMVFRYWTGGRAPDWRKLRIGPARGWAARCCCRDGHSAPSTTGATRGSARTTSTSSRPRASWPTWSRRSGSAAGSRAALRGPSQRARVHGPRGSHPDPPGRPRGGRDPERAVDPQAAEPPGAAGGAAGPRHAAILRHDNHRRRVRVRRRGNLGGIG